MTKKTMIMLLTVVILTAFTSGCGIQSGETEVVEEEYVAVEVEQVVKKALSNVITFNGTIHAADEAMVLPKIPGRVAAVPVKLGDFVAAGDTLVVMDQSEIARNVEQARQSVAAAQRSVEQAENSIGIAYINYNTVSENLSIAEANRQRTQELFEAGAVSKSQLEQAELNASRNALEVAESQVRQAEITYQQSLNQLAQAEITLQQAQSNLEETVVTAPMNGVVSSLNVVAGELVGSTQPLAIISDIDTVYFQTNVAENVVNALNVGQQTNIQIPAAGTENITGTIDFVSQTADQASRLYTLRVYLDNDNQVIRTGMSGTMEVDLNGNGEGLMVNSRALLERGGATMVYVAENDQAIEKEVTVGLNTGAEVEIVTGLQEGETVIVKGQNYVSHGERIKIVGGE